MEFPPELSMDAFTHASQTARQRGLEQLLRGAGAGAGAGLARAGPVYTLRAVVTHSGGINSGHYITYRRGPIDSKQVQYGLLSGSSHYYPPPGLEVVLHLGRGGAGGELRGGEQERGLHALLREGGGHLISADLLSCKRSFDHQRLCCYAVKTVIY